MKAEPAGPATPQWSSRAAAGSEAFDALRAACGQLRFERHQIAAQLDAHGHYEVELDREFAFYVRLFHFRSRRFTPDRTWHEQLELFLPLDGPARLRMGEHRVELVPGDVLVVDNLKLHNVEDFPELDTRVVVLSFLPEFVYSLGSPSHDYAFLLPFYSQRAGAPHILQLRDEQAGRCTKHWFECWNAVSSGSVVLISRRGARPVFFRCSTRWRNGSRLRTC